MENQDQEWMRISDLRAEIAAEREAGAFAARDEMQNVDGRNVRVQVEPAVEHQAEDVDKLLDRMEGQTRQTILVPKGQTLRASLDDIQKNAQQAVNVDGSTGNSELPAQLQADRIRARELQENPKPSPFVSQSDSERMREAQTVNDPTERTRIQSAVAAGKKPYVIGIEKPNGMAERRFAYASSREEAIQIGEQAAAQNGPNKNVFSARELTAKEEAAWRSGRKNDAGPPVKEDADLTPAGRERAVAHEKRITNGDPAGVREVQENASPQMAQATQEPRAPKVETFAAVSHELRQEAHENGDVRLDDGTRVVTTVLARHELEVSHAGSPTSWNTYVSEERAATYDGQVYDADEYQAERDKYERIDRPAYDAQSRNLDEIENARQDVIVVRPDESHEQAFERSAQAVRAERGVEQARTVPEQQSAQQTPVDEKTISPDAASAQTHDTGPKRTDAAWAKDYQVEERDGALAYDLDGKERFRDEGARIRVQPGARDERSIRDAVALAKERFGDRLEINVKDPAEREKFLREAARQGVREVQPELQAEFEVIRAQQKPDGDNPGRAPERDQEHDNPAKNDPILRRAQETIRDRDVERDANSRSERGPGMKR